MRTRLRQQSGFNLVELIIAMCIVAILASVAISAMRDYTLRARISEVVLATSDCKNSVAEAFPVRDSAPDAGKWGCEKPAGSSTYAGVVQTSTNGAIRVAIQNLGHSVDNRYIYLVPAHSDGITAMTAAHDLGNSVRGWICGSDWPLARNALPANCRVDMTTFANDDDFSN